MHSSCIQANFLFIFCGKGSYFNDFNSKSDFLNSVERIDLTDGTRWELIEPLMNDLMPRIYTLVCPVNESQIILMGGLNINVALADMWMFDLQTERFTELIEPEGRRELCSIGHEINEVCNLCAQPGFFSYQNQCGIIADNTTLVSLVYKEGKPGL